LVNKLQVKEFKLNGTLYSEDLNNLKALLIPNKNIADDTCVDMGNESNSYYN